MPEHTRTGIAVMAALFLIAAYSPNTLLPAQVTHTGTVTETTNVYSTTTQETSVTTPTTAYTTTTETINSTIRGTQTRLLPSVTLVNSTVTYTVGGILTSTSSITLTTVSTQTTEIIGNIWGESLAAVVFVGAIASYLIRKVGPRRPKGIVCRNCGNLNPPFGRAFCVKCGHTLEESS
ncbi:MAG TPA: hypothetical protein VED86_00075 [archaeon]|nr:hypothetical protein [archaeon]